MATSPPGGRDHRPTDELGNELRRAVEDILGDEPPEDLMRRTLDRVRAQKPTVGRTMKRWFGLAGALAAAAACVAVLALVWQPRTVERRHPEQGPWRSIAQAPVDADDRLPTLWAYRQASLDSPEALNAMLDKHAARLLPADPKSLRMGGFSGLAPEVL